MVVEMCPLSELADIIVGFPFESEYFNTEGKGVKLVRGMNVTTGSFRWDEDSRWWDNITPDLDPYFLKKDDIIVGMDGSRVGKNYAKVKESDLPLLLVQRVACIRAKEGVDQDFLWACISSQSFESYIDLIKTGTTIPHISSKQLGEYPVPDLESSVQKIVGKYSCIIDSEIHVKERINDNLLRQLESKYRNLMDFSDYDNLIETELGQMPDNWHIEQVSSYCKEMKNGATPSRSRDEYWVNGSIPWVVTGEVNDSIILDTDEKITDLGLKNSSAKLLPIDTIVMAMYGRGTAARLAYLKIEATTNQACCGMICSTPNRSAFLYETLHQMHDYIDTLASGSVQQNLSKEIIGNLKFMCPPDKIIESLELSKMFDMMTINEKEIRKLSEIKDYLLPKLMSGEMDVSTLRYLTKYSFAR